MLNWCSILIKSHLCVWEFFVVSQVVCFCLLVDAFELIGRGLVRLTFPTLQAFKICETPPNLCYKNPLVSWRVFSCSHSFIMVNLKCKLHFPFPITHVHVVLFHHENNMLSLAYMLSLYWEFDAHVVAYFSWVSKCFCGTTILLLSFEM